MKQALDAVGKSHDGLILHNVRIGPLRTSLRLDAPTWSALREIAQREGLTLHQLCTSIKEAKPSALSLTAAIRCYALHYFCDVATADAHDRRKTTRC